MRAVSQVYESISTPSKVTHEDTIQLTHRDTERVELVSDMA